MQCKQACINVSVFMQHWPSLHYSHGHFGPGCRAACSKASPAKIRLQWLNIKNFINDPSSTWLLVLYCKHTDTEHTLRPWERLGLLLERCIIRTSLTWSAVHSWAGHTQSQSFPSSISLSSSLSLSACPSFYMVRFESTHSTRPSVAVAMWEWTTFVRAKVEEQENMFVPEIEQQFLWHWPNMADVT